MKTIKKSILVQILSLFLLQYAWAQTQGSDITASLNDLGGGGLEVIFTPQVALSGIGNPLNVYLRIPEGQQTGNTLSIVTNPYGLSFISESSTGGFHYYQFQGQPSINLATWPANTPQAILEVDFSTQPTETALSGGEFGSAFFTGSGYIWPGTSVLTNNTETNLVHWPINAAIVLPIELLSFAARPHNNTDAILEWSTVSEVNSDRFEVERSNDGRGWQRTGNVAAASNSHEKLDYAMADRKVFDPAGDGPTIFYYRLKMVDLDGSFEYSEVRKVEFERQNGPFFGDLFPNPTAREGAGINLPLQLEKPSEMYFSVIDINGKMILSEKRFLEPGDQLVHFGLFSLPAGQYRLKVAMGQEVFSRPFTVQ